MSDTQVVLVVFCCLVLLMVLAGLLFGAWATNSFRKLLAEQNNSNQKRISDLELKVDDSNRVLAEQRMLCESQAKTIAKQRKRRRRMAKLLNDTRYSLEVAEAIVVKREGQLGDLVEKYAVSEGKLVEASMMSEFNESEAEKAEKKVKKLETERMRERSQEVAAKIAEGAASHAAGSVL